MTSSTVPLLCFTIPLIAFVAIAGAFIYALYKSMRIRGQIKRDGVLADGEILNANSAVAGRGGRVYSLTYRFDAQLTDSSTQPITRSEGVGWLVYQRNQAPGTRVEIKYLPTDPAKTARLAESLKNVAFGNVIAIGFSIVFILVGLFMITVLVATAVNPNSALPALTATPAASPTIVLTPTPIVAATKSAAPVRPTRIRKTSTPN